MYKVTIYGKAKQANIFEEFLESDQLDQNVLKWLRLKRIPIASSCDGEGVCNKCIINGSLLSCQINLRDLLDQKTKNINIQISYL